jgi:CDP-glucose 4,6-dehydratase
MTASHLADIRDLDALVRVFRDHRPEVVFHLAAQPLVRYSYAHPVETYATNVLGTVHLLDAARRTQGVRVLVNITTDKCYENREWLWPYRETDALGGHDPYSNSKGCAELVSAAYRSSYFHGPDSPALATARAGNVIGGGDWALDRLIPDMIRAFSTGQPVIIRSPGAIRPWQHVLEPLHGYLRLAERLYEDGASFAEAWNFGPGEEDARPVAWIVERLAALWGKGATWRLDPAQHPHEATTLRLDCSKARARLGWEPHWDLAAALERLVCWYQAFQLGEDMRALTLQQIADYSRALSKD